MKGAGNPTESLFPSLPACPPFRTRCQGHRGAGLVGVVLHEGRWKPRRRGPRGAAGGATRYAGAVGGADVARPAVRTCIFIRALACLCACVGARAPERETSERGRVGNGDERAGRVGNRPDPIYHLGRDLPDPRMIG
jgi:hypothetical protein